MAAILESRSVARLREAKSCGLRKKGWKSQCQMVGLRLEWSIHAMSFNVLLTCARLSFWASFCRGIVTHISFGWFQDLGEELGRIDVVKLRIWLALGFGVPALFGGDALCSRMPKGAKVELICIIHKKRGKTHSSPNRSRLGWKLNPQTQSLNPAKGFGCRECLKIKGSQNLDLLKIQFSHLNDAFPGNFCNPQFWYTKHQGPSENPWSRCPKFSGLGLVGLVLHDLLGLGLGQLYLGKVDVSREPSELWGITWVWNPRGRRFPCGNRAKWKVFARRKGKPECFEAKNPIERLDWLDLIWFSL